MIGQQDQIGVEHRDGVGFRLLAVQHIQKVRGMAQPGARGNRRMSIADTLPGGHEGRHNGRQQ